MTGILLDGKKTAQVIQAEVAAGVAAWRKRGIVPKLSVILVGDDPASAVYARAKGKSCGRSGIEFELHTLPGDTPEAEVLALIGRLNNDAGVHGIMIELPLPAHINKKAVLESILPVKDVDGVHPVNRGYLLSGGDGGLFPAAARSCVELMKRNGVEIRSKKAVLVGRGETVGKPLIYMMLNENATVTVCHTKTRDLATEVSQGDIVIAAVGQPRMIKSGWLKPGAVVVDAGVNEIPGGLCGDVDFENARHVASYISPVPGGVGSLTSVIIQQNLLNAVRLQIG